MSPTILILPGLFNSDDAHWQTVWESQLPNAKRVQQKNWESPDRADWVSTLDDAIAVSEGPVILAAHSLGCALTVWWASEQAAKSRAVKVVGALLVAPPDVEHENFPAFVTGFSPMPRDTLPFETIVVASSDDPWCALTRAKEWADAWSARFHDIGPRGHINGESNLGAWPEGRSWLSQLASATPA
jgi:uncharacterized protein